MAEIDNRKWLYDTLTKKGVDMGSYEDFDKNVDSNKEWVYSTAKNKGIDIGDFDTFDKAIGKVVNSIPQDVASKTPSPYVSGKGKSVKIFGVPYNEYMDMSPQDQSSAYQKAIDEKKKEENRLLSGTIDGQKKAISDEIGNIIRESTANEVKKVKEHPFFSFLQGTGQHMTGGRNQLPMESDLRYQNLRAASNLAEESDKLLKEAKADKSSAIRNFGRGFKDMAFDIDTWANGVTELQDNLSLAKTLNKAEKGEELTSDEQKLLDASVMNLAVNAFVASDISSGYNIGQTSAYSIPFMLDFAINPVSRSGNVVAKKLLSYGAKRFGTTAGKATFPSALKTGARKMSGRLVGDAVAAVGMTGTTGLAHVGSGTLDLVNAKYSFDADESGKLVVKKNDGPSIAKASIISGISELLERQSEVIFNAFRGMGGTFYGGVKKTLPGGVNEFFSKISSSKPGQLYKDLKNNPAFMEMAKRTQFHGLPEEYLEEVYNNFANIPLGTVSLEEATDIDKNIETFLSLAPTSVVMGMVGLGGMAHERYSNKRKMKQAFGRFTPEQQLMFDELQQRSKEKGNKDIQYFIKATIADGTLTPEQKRAEIEYAYNIAINNAIEDIQQEQSADSKAADDNFIAGAELPPDQHYNAEKERVSAGKALQDVDSNLHDTIQRYIDNGVTSGEIEALFEGVGEQEIELARDFYNKSMKVQGVIENAYDDAVEAGNEFEQAVSQFTDESGSSITTALYKEQPVCITSNDGEYATIVREDGQKEIVLVKSLSEIQTSELGEFLGSYRDKILDSAQQKTDMSLNHHPKTQTPSAGMEIWNGDIPFIITSVENGDVSAYPSVLDANTEKMIPKNGSTPVIMSMDEALALQDDYYNRLDAGKSGMQLENGESSNINMSENLPQNENLSQEEYNNSQEKPANKIPYDEKGNLLYHLAPIESTIEDLNDGNLTQDEIDGFIEANVNKANKELDKINKSAPKIGTNKAKYLADKEAWQEKINDAQAKADYWKQVSDNVKASRIQPGDIISEEITTMGDPQTGEELAAVLLGAGKLPILYDSYKQETGFSDTEARGMIGLFVSKDKGGMTIEKAGEQLMLTDLENGTNFFDQNDPNAGRNAIIDVLSSVRTRGGLTNYIRNNRELTAERERQAEFNAYEKWVYDNFGVSVEEYEAYESDIFEDLSKRNLSESDYNEFISTFVGEQTDIQDEQQGINTESAGSSEILQREEPVQGERTGGIDEKSTEVNVGVSGSNGVIQETGESIQDKIEQAEAETDTNPSEAQKEAGNYKKGKVSIQGFDISIEQPKGSIRSGKDADGKEWSVTMNNTYGYIRKTEGKDGDHIDVFLGDNPENATVFVVDQVNKNGSFDEHKVLLGFNSIEEAKIAYLSNYEGGWQGLGAITEVNIEDFRKWAEKDGRRIKPFAEYKDNINNYIPAFLSEEEYVENKVNDFIREKNISKEEFLNSDEYINVENEIADSYKEHIANLHKEGKLQSLFNSSNIGDQIKIRKGIEAVGFNVHDLIDTKNNQKETSSEKNNLKKVESIRFYDGQIVTGEVISVKNGKVTIDKDGVKYTVPLSRILDEDEANQEINKLSEPNAAIQTQINWNFPEDHKSVLPKREETTKSPNKFGYSAKRTKGGITYAERQLTENGNLTFMGAKLTGAAKIKSSADIAFLFKNLESAATENAFAVLHKKNGSYSVLYLGTGATNQTQIDIKQIVAAANELGAISVTLVHNHPSGNLMASRPDMNIHKLLSNALNLSGKKLNDSVIINLDSGKYSSFNESIYDVFDKKESDELVEVPVFQFDRQVLYVPSSDKKKIRSSQDVAEFLSAQKRGTVPKIQIIIVDSSNNINRYLLIDPNLSREEISGIILNEIGKHGEAAIIASNGAISESVARGIQHDLSSANANLLDVLEIQQDADILNNYKSFVDEGILSEPTPENPTVSGEEERRMSISGRHSTVDTNRKFNEELQQQIDGALPKGHIYRLGNPSDVLLSSGIPNLPIELASSRLSDKAMQENHPFELSEVKDLPNAIQNPLAIFEYGDKNKSVNIITEIEKNGEKFLVGLFINPKVKGKNLEVNSIRNVFPKNSESIIDWINKGKGLFYNKEKVLSFLDQQQTNSVDVAFGLPENQAQQENSKLSATKIVESFENPTVYEGKIVAAIKDLSQTLNSPVKTVRSLNELPESDVRKRIESGAKIKGWYDSKSGEVVVYLPNATSIEDARATILHELVGHKGLRKLFGNENFDKAIMDVYKLLPVEVRSEISDIALRDYNGNITIVTEEYLAKKAESNESPTWWEKVTSRFKDLLRKLGVDITLSDNDVKYLLWRSRKNLENSDIMGHAENIVMRKKLGIGEFNESNYEKANQTVKDFTSKYNSADVLVIRNANVAIEQAKAFGIVDDITLSGIKEIASDGETSAVYSPYYDKILIFAENGNSNYESTLFHENFHRAIKNADISEKEILQLFEEIYPIKKDKFDKVLAFYEEIGYSDIEAKEECVVYSLEAGVYQGFDTLFSSSDSSSVLHKILNYIGYDERKEQRGGLLRQKLGEDDALRNDESPQADEENNDKSISKQGLAKTGGESSKETDSIRFRIEDDGIFDDKELSITERQIGAARHQYERTLQTATYKAQESWQDSMLGLKEAQDAIARATNSKILDYENAYMAENALSSKSLAEMNAYRELLYKPMLKEISNLQREGEKYSDVINYLISKHGIERNREMAVRKALAEDSENEKEYLSRWEKERNSIHQYKNSWKEKQHSLDELAMSFGANLGVDYSGLSAIYESYEDMEFIREAAYESVEEFEKNRDTSNLLKAIKEATSATLIKQRESGLMSQESFESIQNMYEFYLPLRGWEEKTADEVYNYFTSEQSSFNAPMKTAKGRKSKADDPIATIANIAESGILQGNRNLMKQKFLTMVQNHRTDLVSISEVWVTSNPSTEEWTAIFPEIPENATPEQVESIVSKFNDKMEALSKEENSNVKKVSDMRNIPYKILPGNVKEHQIIVKQNGKAYVLTINGNPRAAQALNGLTNPEATENPIIKGVEKANRFLAANFTARNPAFVVSNMFRDGFYANSAAWVKESPTYAIRFNKNWGKSLKEMGGLVSRYKANKLDMDNPTDRLFAEFIKNGGETGYTFITSVDGYKGVIEKELKRSDDKVSIGKAVNVLGSAMDTFGRWAEDTSRFAAYRTSREMGRSIARSVYDAKEISVNFNKKGSGARTAGNWEKGNKISYTLAWIAQSARGLYIFWNAGVQGLANFGRLAKTHKGKFAGMAASYYALGALVPFMNEALIGLFGGDDDYYNLPEYVRRNNICFYVGGKWLTIPLSIELRAIYGLGELSSGAMTGKENYSKNKLTMKVAEQVSQIFPLDVLEGGGGFSAFTPSYVKPITEAYITNKDWTGIPVYKKNDFNRNMPEWTKVYKGTSPELVKLAEVLNEWSGGTKYRSGNVDINPARIEHLFESYLGGVGTTINKLKKTILMPLDESLQDIRNVPVASSFIKMSNERAVNKRIDEQYFENKKYFEKYNQELKGYKKELQNPLIDDFEYAKYQKLYNDMIKSEEYNRFLEFKDLDKELKKKRDLYEETGSEDLLIGMYELKGVMNEVAKPPK